MLGTIGQKQIIFHFHYNCTYKMFKSITQKQVIFNFNYNYRCIMQNQLFLPKVYSVFINYVAYVQWNHVNLDADNLKTSASGHHFIGKQFPNANIPH